MQVIRALSLLPLLLSTSAPPAAIANGGPDLRPELEVSGRVDSIEIAPSGEIWFGTATGHVYVSRDWNRTWDEAAVPVRSSDPLANDTISQVRFFDARRAILVGYLGEDLNRVYRTVDGGATWTPATMPEGLWVYDAQTTPAGLAWLVGSNGGVLFSSDFGASWSSLRAPFDDVSRSHTVHFVSRARGVVGSLDGSLKQTLDGGRSWRSLRTPTESKVVTCKEGRIERARLQGENVVVQQCGGVFVRSLDGKAGWRELRAGTLPLRAYELTADGLIAVASDFGVVKCSSDLKACLPTGFRLEAFPLDVTVRAGTTVLLDDHLKVSVLDVEGFRSARMLGRGVTDRWPISERDRGPDGAFWGISRYYLYRSADNGAHWERMAELPKSMNGVAIQASGEVLVWDRHGTVVRFSPGTGRLAPVPVLDGLDIVGLFRRGSLWLVYGGMQYQTTQRIEVGRTYFSGQFAGSVDHGFVAASTDGGGTWHVVDEWKDGGVQALFLGEDNTLALVSWLCAVRRGRLDIDASGRPAAALETILPATKETWKRVPYVEQVHVLEFLRGEVGWVKGWTHHLGDFVFATTDGGKTWEQVPSAKGTPDQLLRLGDGSWIGLFPPHDVRLWKAGAFASLRAFPGEIDWSVVDATGSLVLHIDNGETWLLPSSAGEWRLLHQE